MNKGLFVHLVSFVIYIMCIGYITQWDDYNINVRVKIVFIGGLVQFIVTGFNDLSGNYKKNI